MGQKLPNAWGLYDMHGNVFEWCLDQKSKYPDEAVTDPVETGKDDDYRAIRGGSYDYYDDGAKNCRSAARNVRRISAISYSLGFRVALVRTGSKNILIPLAKGVNLNMNWIEPGTFMMGSPEDELGRLLIETQHQVTLSKGYWLGKYEVTQAQYEAIMGTNPSNWKGADLPVERVSWYDAVAFCAKLTAQEQTAGRLPEGYEYTLPTEAQWEYACRAGTTTALNSGKNLSDKMQCPEMDEVGWYVCNSGEFDSDGNWTWEDTTTHPVGQKKPNAWGVHDMHGNVQEWCLDRYRGLYPPEATDPVEISTGTNRVLRGGCWNSFALNCRSAFRDSQDPTHHSIQTGFRVALTPVK